MSSQSVCKRGLLICIVALVSLGAGQDEQWLRYRFSREAGEIGIRVNPSQLAIETEKPSDVELPEFQGDRQHFAKWSTPMVERGYLWVALDGKGAFGPNDLLYVDSDGDGDLKDESPITAFRMDQYNGYYGPVKVLFEIDDGPVTYHLNFRRSSYGDERRLYVSSGGWYEGDITIDGAKKQCVLADYNGNGTFDDKSVDLDDCDRIRIGGKSGEADRFVGNYIDVDDVLYRPEIARDGAYIKLARAEGVTYGRLQLAEAVTELAVSGENGLFVLKPEKGVASLPTGTYSVRHWAIERADDSDAAWKVSGYVDSEVVPFDVTEETEIELTVGEQIVATLEVGVREGTHSFRHSTKGRDGERINLTRNGRQPRAPKLRIKNKEGTYDRIYSFAYG